MLTNANILRAYRELQRFRITTPDFPNGTDFIVTADKQIYINGLSNEVLCNGCNVFAVLQNGTQEKGCIRVN